MATLRTLLVAAVLLLGGAACSEKADVEFRMYAVKNQPEQYRTITPEDLGNSTFGSQDVYVFLFHDVDDGNGFHGSFYPQVIRKFLMKFQRNYVVIAAGYASALQGAGDVPAIAERCGELMVAVARRDVNPERFQAVGHGLGAHVAGGAASHVDEVLGVQVRKIYALDPTVLDAANAKSRLKKEDAQEVAVVHTSDKGIQDAIGHTDFYPNGGLAHKECQQYVPLDDHRMALYYFVCSIIKDCRMYARRCESWEAFAGGACAPNFQARMGFNDEQDVPAGKYYLYTFCREAHGKNINL